jgi:hypothetical protein
VLGKMLREDGREAEKPLGQAEFHGQTPPRSHPGGRRFESA